MRRLLFSAAVIVGAVFGSLVPATAAPLAISGLSSQSTEATLVEKTAGVVNTGATAILCRMPTTLPRMGTTRLHPHTHTIHPGIPIIHPRMTPMLLRPPLMVTIFRLMATTVRIHLRMATMATMATMVTICPRMASDHPRHAVV